MTNDLTGVILMFAKCLHSYNTNARHFASSSLGYILMGSSGGSRYLQWCDLFLIPGNGAFVLMPLSILVVLMPLSILVVLMPLSILVVLMPLSILVVVLMSHVSW